MSLITRGPTPGKIGNTNTSTHIAPTLTYWRKTQYQPMIVIEFPFLCTCGYFLSTTVLRPLYFFGKYFHLTSCRSLNRITGLHLT